jgi:NADH:ubiquinone oxidoreductase subunit C
LPADLKIWRKYCRQAGRRRRVFEFAQDELVLKAKRDEIVNVLTHLRDDGECRFTQLDGCCGCRLSRTPERFDVVYNMLSPATNHRVRVKLSTEETLVPSATAVFSVPPDWFEREVWDMYGILFSGTLTCAAS